MRLGPTRDSGCGTNANMSHDPFYWSRPWRATRAEHLEQHPWCAVCAAIGIRTAAVEVDHVVDRRRCGDPHDHENLRSLCKLHHGQKTIASEGQHKGKKRFNVTGPDGFPIPYGDE